ncbi:ATP-binding protein [Thermodesulfobacteriota bacterium]
MIQNIDVKLRQLVPVIGDKKVKNLRLAYLLEDDFKEKKQLENHIDYLISKHVTPTIEPEIILPPPADSSCSGELYLGEVEYLKKKLFPFNLKLRDANRHIFVGGATGSGKTTLALHMIRQLHKTKIPFLIIDWEKSYRDLAKEYEDIEVFTIGKDDINPLFLNILNVPPGIETEEYIKSLIALLADDFLSGAGSDTMFMQYLDEVYRENKQPTFTNLKEHILKQIQNDMKGKGRLAGRSGLWKETVMRIISFLRFGSSGNVLNTNKHYPLEQLFSKNVVLEFGGIKNPRDRKFLIHVILNWLSLYLEHRGIACDELKQVMIFEEFHNICMKSKEDNMVSNLFRECRKYGLGLIAIDQTPSEIPNPIFANCNVKVSFTLATSQDITAMSKAMNLNPFHYQFLGMLETGQAIINIKQGFTDPFVIRVPFVKQTENISDEELKMLKRTDSEDSHLICSSEAKTSPIQAPQSECIPPPNSNKPLSGMEKVIIIDINNHPFDGVDKRRKRLNLHPSEIKTITDDLIRNGIIKPVLIDNLKLFELLDAGKDKAEQIGLIVKKTRTRGSIEHSYVVMQIRDHLIKIGLDPELEKNDIDVVVRDPEEILAAEIETGKAQPYRSIKKLLQSHYKYKYLIATRKETEQMLKRISSTMPDIKVLHYKDFLKFTPHDLI